MMYITYIESMISVHRLAFCSADLQEDPKGDLFGRLTERRLAGVPVPNPKKVGVISRKM